MAILYTSNLLEVTENPIEILIDRVDIFALRSTLVVSKFSAQDELIGDITPPTSYVENCVADKTRIRVFLDANQLAAGEKIQVKLVEI